MKKIISALLVLTTAFAFLFGCENAEIDGEKTNVQSDTCTESGKEKTDFPNDDVLKEDSEKYVLALPSSNQIIELEKGHISDERYIEFIPHISQELVINAELQLLSETEQYGNRSDFYLQIDADDYLCLAVEVIKQLDLSSLQEIEGEFVAGGCGIDHEHLFFEKRISTKAVKETDDDNADIEIYYGMASFFNTTVSENVDDCVYEAYTLLTSEEAERLLSITNGIVWVNDNIVDRESFVFNGCFELAATDECIRFGYEQRILYSNGRYAEISEDDVIFLTKLHGKSKPDPYIDASKEISAFLDETGMVHGTSQGDLIELMDRYSSNISEDMLGALCHYDGPNGGGCMSNGDTFGFSNDYFASDDGKVTYKNSFYTKTQLNGLKFPCNIEFGDTFMSVITRKMHIKYPEIILQMGQELELYRDETRRISAISDGEDGKNSIVYTESYKIAETDTNSPIKDVQRTLVISFDADDRISSISASVTEAYENQ